MGGPSPAKKALSVGFVYFCVPHEMQHLVQRTKQSGRQAPALPGQLDSAFQSIAFPSVNNFSIYTIIT